MRRFLNILINLLGIGIVAAGLIWFFSPLFYSFYSDGAAKDEIAAFKLVVSQAEQAAMDNQTPEQENAEDRVYPKLYQAMEEYNRQIYLEDQAGLTDAWSYEQIPVALASLWEPDTAIGYISIPSMDVELPLFLGASTSQLAKGAAVMTQTSMPIGGENTNCVIAGHRGYKGAAFFREIERIQVGDCVYVTNPWETLIYQVTALEVIYPSDSSAILIQDGRDMLTLITCHPYRSQGKYRYVVYCDRVESAEDIAGEAAGSVSQDALSPGQEETTTILVSSPDIVFQPSATEIRAEKLVRVVGMALIGIGAAVLLIVRLRQQYIRSKVSKEKGA